jgi:hypothetical protein
MEATVGNYTYPFSSKMIVVTVKPDGTKFLRARAVIEPNVVSAGDVATLTVLAMDQDGVPLAGAFVASHTVVSGSVQVKNATTGGNGVAMLDFQAPQGITEATECIITISVLHVAFPNEWRGTVALRILNLSFEPEATKEPRSILPPIATGVTCVFMLCVTGYAILKKKRKK